MIIKDAIEGLLVFAALITILALVQIEESRAQEEDVRYCYDRRSYPTKVVIVCGTCSCPAGYH